jgi:predicted NAD/FAD-dependent oxidoreductase
MGNTSSGYDRNLDKVLGKYFSKTDKRYINVVAYRYNDGPPRIRIQPSNKNTNPNADANKQWINQPAISGITKEEAQSLIFALNSAVKALG